MSPIDPSSRLGANVVLPKKDGQTVEYRLVGVLGSGWQGTVYSAENEVEPDVAVKVAGQKARAGLQRESDVGEAVNHPCVVRSLGMGRLESPSDQFEPALVMEKVQGKPIPKLYPRFTRRGTVGENVHLIREALTGVRAMHEAGFVHRDLKPKNMMVDPEHDNAVTVVDLGRAKQVTADGVRDDVRSAAGSLIYLLTGLISPTVSVTWHLKRAAIPAVPDVVVDGQSLRKTILRAFWPAAKGGYASAAEFSAALAPFDSEK